MKVSAPYFAAQNEIGEQTWLLTYGLASCSVYCFVVIACASVLCGRLPSANLEGLVVQHEYKNCAVTSRVWILSIRKGEIIGLFQANMNQ